MNALNRRALFLMFFLSGLSSLVYQVIWTRLAFASFGIITPVLSVVLSVFMAGLAIGSWGAGRLVAGWKAKTGLSGIFFYAVAEAVIGLGAFIVPWLFAVGERLLLHIGETDSLGYLSLSALILAIAILPWCICMGATFPLMMAFVRERERRDAGSFSFLYMANVLGGMTGIVLAVWIWIEKFGFRHTLWIAAAGNFAIVLVAFVLTRRHRPPPPAAPEPIGEQPSGSGVAIGSPALARGILFSTGFIAMAMEVVWTRAFTPILRTQVYSFASIVFVYLGATFLGSCWYRWNLHRRRVLSIPVLIPGLAIAALLPVVVNNPFQLERFFSKASAIPGPAVSLLLSICPFCALLGYLTPALIDRYAAGNPASAGRAYAINVFGCILGPLFACYGLLPFVNERYASIGLALPLVIFWLFVLRQTRLAMRCLFATLLAGALIGSFLARDFETVIRQRHPELQVRRDYAASVLSFDKDLDRRLLVNGIGMTKLMPVAKFMAHLPLVFHKGKPASTLVICFGMGTSFRSALSWDVDTTAVELIPGVTRAFAFYHPDTAQVLADPKGHIIIDDGRRYLNRSGRKFDVIIVDPPPPVETAGSSLLFSKEFYAIARQHLNTNGILQMWYPGGDPLTSRAVYRSIHESFPYVRCYRGISGWGDHLIASNEPLDVPDAETLAARMPAAAKKDLLEWEDAVTVPFYLQQALTNEIPLPEKLDPDPAVEITDDHPYNEYYLWRSEAGKK